MKYEELTPEEMADKIERLSNKLATARASLRKIVAGKKFHSTTMRAYGSPCEHCGGVLLEEAGFKYHVSGEARKECEQFRSDDKGGTWLA